GIGTGTESQGNLGELSRPEHFFAILNSGLEPDGICQPINRIVDKREDPFSRMGVFLSEGYHNSQLPDGHVPLNVCQVLFWHGEAYVDGLDLVNDHQGKIITHRSLDDVPRVNQ